MSSTMDLSKMKVVDLRQELQQRGLDTKGNKAALVKRLKDALETELQKELPDTSIADTSTEELDTSQGEESHDRGSEGESGTDLNESVPHKTAEDTEEEEITSKVENGDVQHSEKACDKKQQEQEKKTGSNEQPEEKMDVSEAPAADKAAADQQKKAAADQPPKGDSGKQQKGEKRKHEDDSTEKSQKRRERSPIKEDEPTIDENKVSLSWYDSDLYLQLDKESFLTAKPLHDGAFGFAWAGARATHGVTEGKVYYEVKITEEIKWESFERPSNRDNKRRSKSDRKEEKDTKKTEGGDSKKTDSEDSKKTSSEDSKKTGSEDSKKTEGEDAKKADSEDAKKAESEDAKKAESEEAKKENGEEKPTESTEETKTPMEVDSEASKTEDKSEAAATEENKTENETKEESKTEDTKEKEDKDVEIIPDVPLPTHLFRVGFSLLTCGLQLGEEKYSFGYESTGKFITDNKLEDYGVTFGVGDVIGAFLNITNDQVTITYTVNGVAQPTAITVPRSEFPEENFALFPHVLSRNYAFEMNFGNKEEPLFPLPQELADYVPVEKAENKVAGPRRPEKRAECEIILMVGLPGCGKTHWVKEQVLKNPDKRYTVIGHNLIERMTIAGQPLKNKYKGRWNILLERVQKCLNRLTDIASARRRNYIIDQTNVYMSAQRRKMRSFEGFNRRAVCIVVNEDEQARRRKLNQEVNGTGELPENVILDMKACMTIPEKGESFEEVIFPELNEEEAKEVVKKYNEAGKAAGYGQRKVFRKDDRFNRRGGGYRSYNDNRSYSRYDRRAPQQSWGRSGWDRSQNRDWNRQGRDRSSGYRSGSSWQGSQGGWSSGGHGNWNQSYGRSGGSWGGYGKSQGYGSSGYGSGSSYYGNYYGQYGQSQGWSGQQRR